jgi:hypothetical protein
MMQGTEIPLGVLNPVGNLLVGGVARHLCMIEELRTLKLSFPQMTLLNPTHVNKWRDELHSLDVNRR